jgi:hypothetical protein
LVLIEMMERALHELQRLQASRAGEYVAPPEVVDVRLELNGSNIDTPMPDHDRGSQD